MADPRENVPLDDYDEQRPALDEEPDVQEGEQLPDPEPDVSAVSASEADVLEQYHVVPDREDYEPDTFAEE
jgi:hypothetical protein